MKGFPTWFKDLGYALTTSFMGPIKGFQEFMKTLFEEFKELSKNETATIGDYIKAIFKGVLNGIITVLETSINGAIRGLNGITGIVPALTAARNVPSLGNVL